LPLILQDTRKNCKAKFVLLGKGVSKVLFLLMVV